MGPRQVGVADDDVGIAAANGVTSPPKRNNQARAGTAMDCEAQRGRQFRGSLPGSAGHHRSIDENGTVDQRRFPKRE
nr:hypothetical protein [[Micrococcus luteus] ATCC 49442]